MKTNHKTKWIHIRLSEEEHQLIHNAFEQTTCRALSEYARKKLLDKPITVVHRNQSNDDLVAQLILLRTQVTSIGNNYNQVVKKMHTLKHIEDLKTWLMIHENKSKLLIDSLTETKSKIIEFAEKWSP